MPSDSKVAANIWAVVPAAGVGARMRADKPKQYLEIHGKSVLQHTLDALCQHPRIDRVVVGVARDDAHWRGMRFTHAKFAGSAPGGEQRMQTVLNALEYIIAQTQQVADTWVMVHDAVRPCIGARDIDALIDAALKSDCGALLSVRANDALKRAENGRATHAVNGGDYHRALTPQMFRLKQLHAAMQAAARDNIALADETAAMQHCGFAPRLVAGDALNIKITAPQDLRLAELVLQCARE